MNIDPTQIDSWPSAIVAVAIVLAAAYTIRAQRDGKATRAQVEATADQVDQVTKTLTTNNGGSHIKDVLDRIEESNAEVLASQASLATAVGSLQVDVEALKASAARHHPDDLDPGSRPPF